MDKGTDGKWTVSTALPKTGGLGGAGYGQIALDPTGQFLVIADSSASKIFVLRLSDSQLMTYAGTGSYGTKVEVTNAALTTATFDSPEGIAFNKAGTYLYVADAYSNACDVRAITWTAPATSGTMSPITGTTFTLVGAGGTTFPAKGYANGPGSSAALATPASLAVDSNDNLYISEIGTSIIRLASGIGATPTAGGCTVSLFAGTAPTGTATAPVAVTGSDDGAATSAKFNSPNGVVCIGSKVYVADTTNAAIRLISGGNVTTPEGTSRKSGNVDGIGAIARMNAPQGVAYYGGKAYVADTGNSLVRIVTLADGTTTTHAATGFTSLKGIAVSSTGVLYVTDNSSTAANKGVYQLNADGTKTLVLGSLIAPSNVTVSPTNPNLLYVTDANAVIEVTVVRNADGSFASASKTKTIGLETTATGSWVDNTDPTVARFKMNGYFAGLAVDASGNIYVGDEGNSCIRKIAASTYAVTTVAGIGAAQTAPATNYGFIDGALGTNKLNFIYGLALDGNGLLYFCDYGNHALRYLNISTGVVTTLVGASAINVNANGLPSKIGAVPGALGNAGLYQPMGLAFTASGDLLLTTNDGVMQATAPSGK
jgi:sugar lactone lactonase YvrE